MKWVYIAGPISIDTLTHTRAAMLTFDTLHRAGYHPVCPHWSVFQQIIAPLAYEEWMAYDHETLIICEAVLRLPGESAGADREVRWAASVGIPVFHSIESLLASFKP